MNVFSNRLALFSFGFVVLFIVRGLRSLSWKHRIAKQLLSRPHHYSEEEFGALFAPDLTDAAIRTRRVLSQELQLDLSGLRPYDLFSTDLNLSSPRGTPEKMQRIIGALEEEFDCSLPDSYRCSGMTVRALVGEITLQTTKDQPQVAGR